MITRHVVKVSNHNKAQSKIIILWKITMTYNNTMTSITWNPMFSHIDKSGVPCQGRPFDGTRGQGLNVDPLDSPKKATYGCTYFQTRGCYQNSLGWITLTSTKLNPTLSLLNSRSNSKEQYIIVSQLFINQSYL